MGKAVGKDVEGGRRKAVGSDGKGRRQKWGRRALRNTASFVTKLLE